MYKYYYNTSSKVVWQVISIDDQYTKMILIRKNLEHDIITDMQIGDQQIFNTDALFEPGKYNHNWILVEDYKKADILYGEK